MGKASRGNLGRPTINVIGRDGLGIAGRDGLGIAGRDGLGIAGRDGLGIAGRDGLSIAIGWLGLYKDTTVPTCMTSGAGSLVVKFSLTEQYLKHKTQIASLIIQYLQAPQTLR